MSLPAEAFIKQFEERSLCPSEFDHLGHLRIAWLYLKKYDADQAVEKVVVGIRDYAISLGATEKFHFTLTQAIVRIMKVRIDTGKPDSFACFLQNNRDLVDDCMSVIATYYSQQRINQDDARQRFVTPDIRYFSEVDVEN